MIQSFDANNNLVERIDQSWNIYVWVNETRHVAVYQNGKLAEERNLFWDTQSAAWKNNDRELYSYTGSDLQTITRQSWNQGAGSWQNSSMDSNVYNLTHDAVKIWYHAWNNIAQKWDPGGLDSNNYDLHHNRLSYCLYSFQDSINVVLIRKNLHRYNSFNQRTRDEYYDRSYDSTFQLYIEMKRFDYELYTTGIPAQPDPARNITLYPLPAQNVLNLHMQDPEPGANQISITGLNGRLVMQFQVAADKLSHTAIPVSNLQTGFYLITITGGKEVITRKFEVMR